MTRKRPTSQPGPDNGLGGMLAISLALHLVLFFLSARINLFQPEIRGEETIYVDVLNLPVASPQAGSPSGAARGPGAAPPAPPAPKAEMHLPPQKSAATAPPAAAPRSGDAQETAREYESRLAALERTVESRRQESALQEIQKRVAAARGKEGRPAAGMPKGTGTQAGSDYPSYIQSRLRDAFSSTIAWHTKAPVMVIRLFIDPNGALIRYKIEKSTGDVIFEDAVDQAIQLARKNFPPPPGGKEFSYGFVFKPEGVNKR